jgi:XTP/dITP diphosphohydrolase
MKNHYLLLATTNKGKIKEIKHLLKDLPLKILTISQIKSVPNNIEIEETGKTFAKNATIKAKEIGKLSRLMTLSDDSGLEIDVLGGKPGVSSHRYAKGTDLDRNRKVLESLKGIPKNKRTARFVAAVAIYDPKLKKTKVFVANTEGVISMRLLGKNGFGYDPIFFSTELGKTFAQATIKEKNEVSHRARALLKAKTFLDRYLSSTK